MIPSGNEFGLSLGKYARFLPLQWDYFPSVPYSTYYKPMGDLSYISSEQGGGLIIHHGLIMRITIYKRPIPIQ